MFDVVKYTQQRLSDFNLNYKIRFDRHARRLASCLTYPEKNGDWMGEITFNTEHIRLSTEEQLTDTANHEIAHAIRHLRFGHIPLEKSIVFGKEKFISHDSKWREIAIELGALPKACADFVLPKRYIAICKNCGVVAQYMNKPKRWATYRCSKCKTANVANGKLFLEINDNFFKQQNNNSTVRVEEL